ATKGPARERCQWQIQRPQRSGRRPDGGDRSWRRPGADNPSVSLREPAPFAQGSLPSQASGPTPFGEGTVGIGGLFGRLLAAPSVSKKSFRHAVRIFKL